MKHTVTPRLVFEVERYRLAFACENCAHFEPMKGTCSLEFPNDEHREGALREHAIVFCKSFELA